MPDEDPSKHMVAILELICGDTSARRELLWLRAIEKQDKISIELLERADPTLRRRMTALLAQRGLPGPDDPRRRKEAFAAFWHEHFEALAARLVEAPGPGG
jgi:hypothetical protein